MTEAPPGFRLTVLAVILPVSSKSPPVIDTRANSEGLAEPMLPACTLPVPAFTISVRKLPVTASMSPKAMFPFEDVIVRFVFDASWMTPVVKLIASLDDVKVVSEPAFI